MTQKKQNGNIVAIIMMIALFGMIGFVTNIAAPAGTIWMSKYEGSNAIGMLGNLMNFLAYLVMGIPAGLLLQKIGYKKTALTAIIVGFFGLSIQFVSGKFTGDTGLVIYLLGAFVAGFSMCMLNTVVNPMLNEIGGGGKKGGMLLQIGGSLNSLLGTVAPVFVGALIGKVVTEKMYAECIEKGLDACAPVTVFSDINMVLYIAMAIFAVVGIVLALVAIPEPEVENKTAVAKSPWKYRHFVLGSIGIFIYVGIEVGIPGTMKFFLENLKEGALDPSEAGTVAATYWFLMLIGRLSGAGIAAKVSSRNLLTAVSSIAIILIGTAMLLPSSIMVSMPVFSDFHFDLQTVPISALLFVLAGLCTSVMWGGIFNLAVEGLGASVKQASGIFMMMVVGGGILPLLQNGIVDITGNNYMISYLLPLAGLAYLLFYALIGSKNANKDISVD
ncbi:MAG: MFS transporter [Prevotellaceae bacterium]|jgi:FHS family L-fucose permease-like MFS transporter|nr:MFS transporter [Prevotellaceae bacterium]